MVSCLCTSRITGEFWVHARPADLAHLDGLEHLLEHRLYRGKDEEKPEKFTDRHRTLLWHDFSCSALGVEAEHAFVRVVRAIALLGSGQERAQRESRYEAPDVGPPRDAPAGGGQQELHH
jgi:hypothetical protein